MTMRELVEGAVREVVVLAEMGLGRSLQVHGDCLSALGLFIAIIFLVLFFFFCSLCTWYIQYDFPGSIGGDTN